MKKKLLSLCLCAVLLCLSLCSCTVEGITYTPQENISFNYNNVSASNVGQYWIEKDAVYYYNYNYADIRRIGEEGMRSVADVSIAFDNSMQVHGDKLYVLETVFDSLTNCTDYMINEYDVATGELTRSAYIYGAKAVESEFFVLGDTVYVVAHTDDMYYNYMLKAIDMNTGINKDIAENVFSVGVLNNKLTYILHQGFEYRIYSYEDNESFNIGFFSYVLYQYECFEDYVSYADGKVIFTFCDYAGYEPVYKIVVYDSWSGNVTEYELEIQVSHAIAYEKYLFISEIIYEYDEELGYGTVTSSLVYRFCLETGELEKIADFNAYNSDIYMFVGSDSDVYVSSSMFDGVVHCNADGKKTNVVNYSPIFGLFKTLEEDED